MAQKISPFVEGKYGWNFGESGWNSGMDENLLKFSFLFDRNVDSITASLPTAVNGQAHFLTSDNRLYFAVGTTYFSTPTPKWFEFKIRSTGEIYQFNGTSVTQVASPSQFDSRLDAVEITLSSLGTAAFQDSDIFATQAKLDVVEANAANYTDELRQELVNEADLSKGAAQVARATRHLVDISEVAGVSGRYDGDTVNLLSFWREEYLKGGAAYIGGENIGGGLLTWRADIARSEHDGVLIISPTVPAPANFAGLSDYFSAVGESAPAASGCWVRSFDQGVHLAWAGAVLNDATKDNRYVFEAAKDVIGKRVGGHMPALLLPIGELYYSKSPNFGQYSGFKIIGPGPGSCRLRYTGTGRALELNPAEYDIQFRYGYHLEGFLIDAGASGLTGLYLENVAQSAFREVFAVNGAATCVLFDLRLSVLNEFTTCGVTVNRWAVSSVHQESWRLSTSPSKGGSSTANTFNNCIGEGASLAGWRLIGSDVNTWNGGTGEANTGRGVLIASTSRANTFINFAMEANTTQDARDEGQLTRWIGGYATSDSGFVVGGAAKNVSITGLMCNGVTIETGAVGAAFENVDYNHKGTGTFTDNGTDTRVVNLRDKATGSIVYPKKARVSITVGASPFTYTNNTGRYQQVLISGGTVTQILYKRGADQGVTGLMGGALLVAPGDELVISHSGAPTMSRTPMGAMPV